MFIFYTALVVLAVSSLGLLTTGVVELQRIHRGVLMGRAIIRAHRRIQAEQIKAMFDARDIA